jgi:hypothetical protein
MKLWLSAGTAERDPIALTYDDVLIEMTVSYLRRESKQNGDRKGKKFLARDYRHYNL